MKKFSKKLIMILLIAGVVVVASSITENAWAQSGPTQAGAAQPTIQEVTLKVEGMSCGGCAIGVKKSLEKQAGVKKVAVSLEKGQAVAEIERGKVKPEDLAAAVTKIGYKATVLSVK